MVNLTYPEIAEIKTEALPPASIDALRLLRNQMCESSQSTGFKLQSQQRFLRRVLSPDSPARNLLMIHGTGTGKTCTAIQVAEEYILRPEFQDKKVLVVASAAVQDNFQTQLFDMTRVNIDTIAGTLESKQCTGRRYLDMLLRIEAEPKNWNNPDIRAKLERTTDSIIKEFYEFTAYNSFGNLILSKLGGTEKDIDREWVHENFDNRLVIIDEAHNIRESGKEDDVGMKGVTRAMENLVKTAEGMVLVFLTATPMYDVFEEIIFYMNLFLWNDRKQPPNKSVKVADFFNTDATLKPGAPATAFRTWCQTYVSFVKGENPFTFPFRLPPPKTVANDRTKTSWLGKPIAPVDRIQYLSLTESRAEGIQKEVLTGSERTEDEAKRRQLMLASVAVAPGNKGFNEVFKTVGKQYAYVGEPWLTPEKLPTHSAKFATIIESIESGKGIALVYSNYVTMGARLFAMALEERGYTSALGDGLLANRKYDGPSRGKYIYLTSDITEAEINRLIDMVKSPKNKDGSQIRVIVSSKIVSEGVDFRYMRQLHVIDPWWNMSRIEQVIGRGLRTCSHQGLNFDEQNCTVYLHIIRTGDGKECFDEYTYRTKVEPKAIRIARVRKVLAESAMDCPLQNQINTLPEDWQNLEVSQTISEGGKPVVYRLAGMLAPTFDDTPNIAQCIVEPSTPDPEHVRPLSTYLDVRDELLDKLGRLFIEKPIWDHEQLIAALRPYTRDVIIFNIQQAVTSGFRFKDSFGRPAILESKGDLYALAPLGVPSGTMVERISQPAVRGHVELPELETEEEEVVVEASILDTKREAFAFPADARTRFSKEVLNGYIFDHELTDTEKRSLLKSRPDSVLPFASRLYVPGSDYIVLGKETFEPPEKPVFEDLTAYKAWNDGLVKKFIDDRKKLFASMKNGKLTVSKMTVEGNTAKRLLEKGGKKFEPVICDTGVNPTSVMNVFAKFIDAKKVGLPKVPPGPGKPPKDMTGPGRCIYIELLCREQNKVVWYTPEELAILFDGKGTKANPTNQDTFIEAFRK